MKSIAFRGKMSFSAVVVTAAFLGGVSGQNDNITQAYYTRIDVPSSVLQSVITKEEFPTFSRIACTQRAMVLQRYHLACFSGRICSLYDIGLPSNYQANEGITNLVKCYTDQADGCENDDQFYLDGESRWENCSQLLSCSDKSWIEEVNCGMVQEGED